MAPNWKVQKRRLVDDVDRHAQLPAAAAKMACASSSSSAAATTKAAPSRSDGDQGRRSRLHGAAGRVGGQRLHVRAGLGAQRRDAGAGGGEQLRLPRRSLAAADHDDAPAVEREEQRQRGEPVHAARALGAGASHGVRPSGSDTIPRTDVGATVSDPEGLTPPLTPAMRRLISGMHEPQLVPAPSWRPMLSTLRPPAPAAAAMRAAPTWKQTHTMAPSSTAPSNGMPARSARRSVTADVGAVELGLQPLRRRQLRARPHEQQRLDAAVAVHAHAEDAGAGVLEGDALALGQRRGQPSAPAAGAPGPSNAKFSTCPNGARAAAQ